MSDQTYTVDLNGKRYELNEEVREAIQERAAREYEENPLFSCWWRVATAEDEEHQKGDPILVIETEGRFVPWENLDTLEVEMEEPDDMDSRGSDDTDTQDVDSGSGMKTLPPDAPRDSEEDEEREIGRTHFGMTPRDFEEVPDPDGEEQDKIPPKPESFDEPTMVMWVPDDPSLEHTWSSGEAITDVSSWVEWNVQKYADQPRPVSEKSDGHDHWESILKSHDCDVVGTHKTNQDIPKNASSSDDKKEAKDDIGGKYGGQNWNV